MFNGRQLRVFYYHFFKESNIRPFIRATSGDKSIAFNTIHEASKHFLISADEIWQYFVKQIPYNGWRFSHVKNNDPEAIYAKSYQLTSRDIQTKSKLLRFRRPVQVFDIRTRKVEIFHSLTLAGLELGIRASNIRARISVPEKIRLLYERYVIIDIERNFDFLTEKVLTDLLARVNHGVVVFDISKNTFQFFSGSTAYMRLINRRDTAVSAMRSVRKKGIYMVDKDRYIMRVTEEIRQKNVDELRQCFIEKINTVYKYIVR